MNTSPTVRGRQEGTRETNGRTDGQTEEENGRSQFPPDFIIAGEREREGERLELELH